MSDFQFILTAKGKTHVGMKRKQNQDSFFVGQKEGIFIVADGMGGHLGGEIASQLATESIVNYLVSEEDSNLPSQERLSNAICVANEVIYEKSKTDPSLHGMGTTVTALYFKDRQVHIAQVGDSRCYFILPPNQIWQLTRDHSLVEEKLRAGLITRERVKIDPMKNVITLSVGYEAQVRPDIYCMEVKPQTVFVICCDGISNMLSNTEICSIVNPVFLEQNSLEQAAQDLIDASNEKGADDNITGIVIQIGEALAG
jgi:protein phosphatase